MTQPVGSPVEPSIWLDRLSSTAEGSNESLFEGAGGTAGEIGHTSLQETGDICRCGSRGCLETHASGAAIAALLSRSLGETLTLEDVLARAVDGDPGCRRALADAGRHIGAAAADLCNLINPERIVVGGSMAVAGDVLLGSGAKPRPTKTDAPNAERVACAPASDSCTYECGCRRST